MSTAANRKKEEQLGMSPSTAMNRLNKMIMFDLMLAAGLNSCFRCRKSMTRDTFSVEHKVEWIDSTDPVRLYFDLSNIAFSHLACNVGARRFRVKTAVCGTTLAYWKGCRCVECKKASAAYAASRYSKEKRRHKYECKGY